MITIKRPRQTVPLVTDLALAAAHHQADEALMRAQADALASPMENTSGIREASGKVRELEAAMRASTLLVTLEALPRKVWAEFVAANPPRDGDANDEAVGFNIDGCGDIIGQSITDVTDTAGHPADEFDWAQIRDELTLGQWHDFAIAVATINNNTEPPFSQAALLATRLYELTSKPANG